MVITSKSAVVAAVLCNAMWMGPAFAQVEDATSQQHDVGWIGLGWIEIGSHPGDCRVLGVPDWEKVVYDSAADSWRNPKPESLVPLIEPYSKDAFAVGTYEACPEELPGGVSLGVYERYTVRDDGVRLYAPWGESDVFKFYPYVEGWGYDQRYRFDWIPAEGEEES